MYVNCRHNLATTIYQPSMSACFVWHMTAIPRNKRPINENSVQNPLNRILDAPLFQSAILLVLVIALILVVLLLIVVLVIILIVVLIAVHIISSNNSYAEFRIDIVPKESGFIPGLKQQADNQTHYNCCSNAAGRGLQTTGYYTKPSFFKNCFSNPICKTVSKAG